MSLKTFCERTHYLTFAASHPKQVFALGELL